MDAHMSHPNGTPRVAGLLLAVAVSGLTPAAYASGWGTIPWPENDLALGPGLAFAYGPDAGYMLGFDTAYTHRSLAASVNLKYVGQPGYQLYGAQAEFSYWFVATWGLGAGYLAGDDAGPIFHLFSGFPFGDDHYFVEPYYRLNFFVPDGLQLIHEVGLMVKYTTFHI